MSVVTFLFTDIEGSTRRWESDADAMQVALEAHNQVLRDTVEGHRGTVFNYTGDGMCAVFDSPRSAVDAAIAAQRTLELPVRMGIATGEAELRGREYFGTVLNRTARVMAAGHGGQILLDGATAALLADVELIPLGSKRLRDIAKPVAIYQVQAPGLRADFPPLKTADSAPGNVRAPTTSFVGRAAEVAEIEAALKAHRMVTLTGVGGVGKTRLALEVAMRLVSDFPDGVFVIELAAVTDPAAVPEAVASTLGITQQPGLSMTNSVAAALEGRSRLLVLDNCEHVLDAAADVLEAIFDHSSTVKILATSREGLRLDDEQLWPVPSLDVGSGTNSSAATLFVDRAQTVSPGVSTFAPPQEAAAVVEICRRLDGIPLAIELAASRMVSMTAVEVRDRLDDRFRLLVGSRRALERHQTLRHAVQWSYDLLDDAEKAVLTRCSVFAGGFELPGACAVAESEDDLATLDLLDALVRKSLLVANRPSGHTRFSMLETIRQFGEEQLVASGEAEAARTAHARYFARRDAEVMALWDSPRQAEAYAWVTVELPNLRSAFRWAADRGDVDAAVAIAICATFLGHWVQLYEPVVWAEEMIEPAKAIGHPRLAQLYIMAADCYLAGRTDDFLRYIDAASRATESGRFDAVPVALESALAGGYLTTVGPDRCVEWARGMLVRYPDGYAYAAPGLVAALVYAGRHEEARSVAKGLLVAAETEVNPTIVSSAMYAYGASHSETEPEAAYAALRRGIAIAVENGDRQMESVLALALSSLAATRAKPLEGLEYSALAIRTYYDTRAVQFVSGPLGVLTALLDQLGRYEAAATISGFAFADVALATFPEISTAISHLREALGDEAYESLARAGAAMTNASKAAYALEQIDLARADLQ
ncbi:putative ATPase [Mycobacterium sp. JS623]|uniref:ATP-binding protein n=1 Tax=Mycobacterium sp. JS623 TaxID=212767 RepID=UPI0002A56705|nr:adenylate/guanylate cyclase domain-containing protein [Mycobacterium sp. JS623]AGB20606.1 putative ATPase [Mycobacterium sp. JS623]